MSFSAEVAKESLDAPAPPVTSAPASSKFGSSPNYTAPSIVSKDSQQNTNVAAGRLPEDVYAGTLPSWRAALRCQCVARVVWESEVIAELQVHSPILPSYFKCDQEITAYLQAKVRSPWLDTYFLYASMLGTHTFFLVFLPIFFFFGHDDLGRG